MNIPDYGPYHDYPNSPVGGSNPYWACDACGATDPRINGTLSGHFDGCKWVKTKKESLCSTQVDNSSE